MIVISAEIMKKVPLVAFITLVMFKTSYAQNPSASNSLAAAAIPDPTDRAKTEAEFQSAKSAEKRYQEMLDRMRAAVEEVAQLYGNPTFLQVFTNDTARASELKHRLKEGQSGQEILQQMLELEKKKSELSEDIALKERESAKLSAKLVRQRMALDALAAAVELAQKDVEDTVR